MTVESTAFWATSLMSIGRLTFTVSRCSQQLQFSLRPLWRLWLWSLRLFALGLRNVSLGVWEEESCRVATEWEYLAPTF